MNQLSVTQVAGAGIVRAADRTSPTLLPDVEKLPLRGRFKVEHWRNGKRIDERHFDNGIVTEGKNFLLDVMFHAVTAFSVWYLGLIDNSGYSALAATDIYDDINQAGNGWDEFDDYTDPGNSDSAVTRPAWTEGSASAASITNSATVNFDVTATGTVKGVFLVGGTNAQTKGDHTSGTANKLWATALFSGGDVAVQNGDQLKVTYTVSA